MRGSRRDVRGHLSMLAAAGGVVLLAGVLQVRADQRVVLRGLPRYPIPHVCTSRVLLRVDCPSCGLTRSFIHLAHGDWSASVRVHRLGWLFAGLVLAQIPYRLGVVCLGEPLQISARTSLRLASAVIALLLGNWLLTICGK